MSLSKEGGGIQAMTRKPEEISMGFAFLNILDLLFPPPNVSKS